MTAPDPTAGERKMVDSLGNEHPADDLCDWAGCYPTSPPAVATSTGTSEDEPNVVQRIVDAWDCCGTCAGGVLANHVADREAAARAEERERIAQALEDRLHPDQITAACARIAREG